MTQAYTGFGDLRHSQDDLSQTAFIAQQMMNGMATATLAIVKAVTATTVDVQPMVHQVDGAGKAIPHGVVHALPFFTLRAGAAAIIVTPVIGDIGLVVFCSSDISAAKKNKAPSGPRSKRRFDWADGLYIGGFLGSAPTVKIEVSGGGVFVTGNLDVTGAVSVGDGATGSFSTPGGQTVTVQDGIIISIA